MNELEKALLGAIEMLDNIAHEKSYNVVEYHERMARYKGTLLAAQPSLKDDAYFGKLFKKG